MNIYKKIRSFIECEKAVAASEFALIAPMMIFLWCGVVETTWLMTANKKVMAAAHACSDLVSQENAVNDTKISNIINATQAIMAPYSTTGMRVNVSSVVFDNATGYPTLVWDETVGGAPEGTDPVDSSTGLGLPGESVIVATISYEYQPLFVDLIFGNTITISERSYSRPRHTTVVYRE